MVQQERVGENTVEIQEKLARDRLTTLVAESSTRQIQAEADCATARRTALKRRQDELDGRCNLRQRVVVEGGVIRAACLGRGEAGGFRPPRPPYIRPWLSRLT